MESSFAEMDILRYLIAHRDARDTIEGIEKWWLPQGRSYGLSDIATALSDLEQHDLIRVWTTTSSKPVYGRATDDTHVLIERVAELDPRPGN